MKRHLEGLALALILLLVGFGASGQPPQKPASVNLTPRDQMMIQIGMLSNQIDDMGMKLRELNRQRDELIGQAAALTVAEEHATTKTMPKVAVTTATAHKAEKAK